MFRRQVVCRAWHERWMVCLQGGATLGVGVFSGGRVQSLGEERREAGREREWRKGTNLSIPAGVNQRASDMQSLSQVLEIGVA